MSKTPNLKGRVIAYLASNGVAFDPRGRIMLLTLPRVAGYVFNPVSIYYCFDPAGTPLCAIAEVGNTFGEMKLFLLRSDELRDGTVFQKLTAKHFYVSPFSSLELSFDFKLRIPGEKLDVRIDDRDGDAKILLSMLTGTRAALSNARLLWFTLKYPLVTLKVIALIHWHAFVLWLKRVPLHRKADNPALQREVLRPHATLRADGVSPSPLNGERAGVRGGNDESFVPSDSRRCHHPSPPTPLPVEGRGEPAVARSPQITRA